MIELKNVSKKFGKHVVLDNVNLTIDDGETLLVLGPSGEGKSVLIKTIIGIIESDAGEIIIDGVDIANSSYSHIQKTRSNFGILFQGSTLFDSFNVYENIVFPIRYHEPNFPEDELKSLVKERLSMVGLKDVETLYPAELSGGMQKRIALARALIRNPKYIFYDEPTTGLDPIMSNVINQLIKGINLRMNPSSLIVTHDIEWAMNLVHKVAFLYKGKVRFFGTPDKMRKTDNPYIKQFMSGSVSGPIETHLHTAEGKYEK